jgi:phosphatidylglycerol:prolipoprotein diacylglycerol transferase
MVLLLPYIHPRPKEIDLPGELPDWLDPLVLDPWQLLVIAGFFVGVWLSQNRARDWGLSIKEVTDLAFVMLVSALYMAHWFHVFLYDWEEHKPESFSEFLPTLLNPFYGLSSFGGFVGAALGVIVWTRIRGIDLAAYSDCLVYGLTHGWFLGRLGCSLVHDHPGKLTDSWLGIDFPPGLFDPVGGRRFDLGTLELGLTGVILVVAVLTVQRHRERFRWGWLMVTATMFYSVVRFFLDFLRANDLVGSDPRYFWLTPGQWSAIVLFLAAAAYWRWVVRRKPFPGSDSDDISRLSEARDLTEDAPDGGPEEGGDAAVGGAGDVAGTGAHEIDGAGSEDQLEAGGSPSTAGEDPSSST